MIHKIYHDDSSTTLASLDVFFIFQFHVLNNFFKERHPSVNGTHLFVKAAVLRVLGRWWLNAAKKGAVSQIPILSVGDSSSVSGGGVAGGYPQKAAAVGAAAA